MKIFILGGTGFIGRWLVRRLHAEGHEVTVLVRRSGSQLPVENINKVVGSSMEYGPWYDAIKDSDIVINLAGSPIFIRWTRQTKSAIVNSRVITTANIVKALSVSKKEPMLINASAVGYYGNCDDDEIDEESPKGNGFLAETAKAWEGEALRAKEYGVKVVICRFGVVLGLEGGALRTMIPFYKAGLGSQLGKGNQWMPWVSIKDIINIFSFIVSEKRKSFGIINCTAPYPVQNKEYSDTLIRILNKKPIAPPVPRFMLKLLFGEMAALFLDSQKVLPKRLLSIGFNFQFPRIHDALYDILHNVDNPFK